MNKQIDKNKSNLKKTSTNKDIEMEQPESQFQSSPELPLKTQKKSDDEKIVTSRELKRPNPELALRLAETNIKDLIQQISDLKVEKEKTESNWNVKYQTMFSRYQLFNDLIESLLTKLAPADTAQYHVLSKEFGEMMGTLRHQYADLYTILANPSIELTQNAEYQQKVLAFNDQIDAMETQLSSSFGKLQTDFKSITDTGNQIMNEYEQISIQKEEHEKTIERLQSEITSLREEKKALQKEKVDAAAMQTKLAETEKEMASLQSKVAENDVAMVDHSSKEDEVKRLNELIKNQRDKIDVLQGSIGRLTEELAQMSGAKKARMEEREQALDVAIHEKDGLIRDLENKIKTLIEDKGKRERDAKADNEKELTSQIESLQKKVEKQKRDADAQHSTIVEERNRMAALKYYMPPEYTINPPINGTNYLDTIPTLTISHNDYGSVVFSNINLQENKYPLLSILRFGDGFIEVYPDATFPEGSPLKPKTNEAFNRPAIVTLKGQRPPPGMGLKTYVDLLRSVPDTVFQDYRGNVGEWVFKVEHFTKYSAAAVLGGARSPPTMETLANLRTENDALRREASSLPAGEPPSSAFHHEVLRNARETARMTNEFAVRSRKITEKAAPPIVTRRLINQLGIAERLSLSVELFYGDERFVDPKTKVNPKLKGMQVLHDSVHDIPLFMGTHMLMPDIFADPRVPVWLPPELIRVKDILGWVDNHPMRQAFYTTVTSFQREYGRDLYYFNATIFALLILGYMDEKFFEEKAEESSAVFGMYYSYYKEHKEDYPNTIELGTVSGLLDVINFFYEKWNSMR